MKTYILDSYAMIAFFEDEIGADRVAKILNEIVHKKAKGLMSVINWGEIYYNTMREAGEFVAKDIINRFDQYPIQLIDADKSQTLEAAKLKGKHRIAYADCFAAALSKKYKGTLVTGDREFEKLASILKIIWID